jgi:hypothetical protein
MTFAKFIESKTKQELQAELAKDGRQLSKRHENAVGFYTFQCRRIVNGEERTATIKVVEYNNINPEGQNHINFHNIKTSKKSLLQGCEELNPQEIKEAANAPVNTYQIAVITID